MNQSADHTNWGRLTDRRPTTKKIDKKNHTVIIILLLLSRLPTPRESIARSNSKS
jgi:hypothetical protein